MGKDWRFAEFWNPSAKEEDKQNKSEYEWMQKISHLQSDLSDVLLFNTKGDLVNCLPWMKAFNTDVATNMAVEIIHQSITVSIENIICQLSHTLVNDLTKENKVDGRILQTLEWYIDPVLDTCVNGLHFIVQPNGDDNSKHKEIGFKHRRNDYLQRFKNMKPLISVSKLLIKLTMLLTERKKKKKKDVSDGELNSHNSNPLSSRDYVMRWSLAKLNACAKHALLRLIGKFCEQLAQIINYLSIFVDKRKTISKQYDNIQFLLKNDCIL